MNSGEIGSQEIVQGLRRHGSLRLLQVESTSLQKL